MKTTIFRRLNAGLLLAAAIVLGLGAISAKAQDPCADAAGITSMQDEFDGLYKAYVARSEEHTSELQSH